MIILRVEISSYFLILTLVSYRGEPCIRALAAAMERRKPLVSIGKVLKAAVGTLQECSRSMTYALTREEEQLRMSGQAAGGGGGMGAGPSTGAAATMGEASESRTEAAATAEPTADSEASHTCPICLDHMDRKTVTVCGHMFCSDCIHEIVGASSSSLCPICRRGLRPPDLFDSVSEQEQVSGPKQCRKYWFNCEYY